MTKNLSEDVQFRASAGTTQGFGRTPLEALSALMSQVSTENLLPIVILPYNRGDAFFSEAQFQRLQELKARGEMRTSDEQTELERLVAASFEATIARTQTLQNIKS